PSWHGATGSYGAAVVKSQAMDGRSGVYKAEALQIDRAPRDAAITDDRTNKTHALPEYEVRFAGLIPTSAIAAFQRSSNGVSKRMRSSARTVSHALSRNSCSSWPAPQPA